MSNDTTITIRADILQLTDNAVLVNCEEEQVWLPLSQIDFDGERGDTDVLIHLPEWLGDENGLHDGAGMKLTPVIDVTAPQQEPESEPGSPPAPQTTPITLTIHSLSENGESANVEDRHGNQWDLPTADFSHDETDLVVGDTVLCHVQTSALVDPCPLMPDVPADAADTPTGEEGADSEGGEGDDEAAPEPAPSSGAQVLKSETITVSVPLDPSEREAVGDRMAKALEQISELQDRLDSHRKHINAQIKILEKEAEAARMEWREGKTEEVVYCDMVADYDEVAIIWRDHVTGIEMKRRRMTADERQFRLPLAPPASANAAPVNAEAAEQAAAASETIFGPLATRTCINCGHLNQDGDDTLPEPCQTCSRCDNGDNDNWTPKEECATCAHAQTKVTAWPCAGCSLNVEEAHRGETPRWEWADAERDPAAPETPEPVASDAPVNAEPADDLPPPPEVSAPATSQSAEAAGA